MLAVGVVASLCVCVSKILIWYFGFRFSQLEIQLDIPRKILPAFKGVGVGARRHGKRRRRPMEAPLASPGASPHRLGGRSSINLQRRRALRPVPAKGRPHKHQPRSAMKLVIFTSSFLAPFLAPFLATILAAMLHP